MLISEKKQPNTEIGARFPKITLLIPARNEEKNLPHVLPRIPKIVSEVILVDGLSTDRTNQIARELRPDIRIVKQDGIGKGNAIGCGIKAATGDIIVMCDADGSMDPAEAPVFIEPLLHDYDLVRGSRFMSGGGTTDMEVYRKFGNSVFTFILNALFGAKATDLCYGYMAFKREQIQKFVVESDGFEIETELTVKSLKAGLRTTEVPSFETKRVNGSSNLRAFKDGKRILRTLFKLRFSNSLKKKPSLRKVQDFEEGPVIWKSKESHAESVSRDLT